ncbi:MAG: sigma-70 family RNA polymerase sigma factor [Verrucomicrobiota bacterium]|nr:sigma-70 family RNA polymerase sigma factor [Verrucomicrobiota bacterium]
MIAATATMTAVTDQERFTRLLDEHAGIIQKVARGYTKTQADREDLMQEITLQLWRAYPRYSPKRPFSTWMYRIALNLAISFLRRQTHPVRQTLSLEENQIDVAGDAARDPEMDERVAILQHVIDSLPPLERGLMLLYLDEHSYREIAAILGLSETNVATKLNRLKQRVREEILKLNQTNS